MKYTRLGETGLNVSVLCLGTGAFSHSEPDSSGGEWTIHDEQRCCDIVNRALDAGINFIDTANLYAGGESEAILGEIIDGRRNDLVLASKVGKRIGPDPNDTGLSRRHIMQQIEASLSRLGTDYLDLYYIHAWDETTPIAETLSTLDSLVDKGLVRYVGASNLAGWQLTKALYTSDIENYERFVCVQPEYNLVARHEEQNVLPVAADQGLGVVPYAPLAAGFLAGTYDRDTAAEKLQSPDDTYRALDRYASEGNWAVLDEVRTIADSHDATPVQVSIAWLCQKDVIDASIIGPRTVDQLEEYLGALEITLTESEIDRLQAPLDPSWDDSLLNL
jgi:aryl-alcohol dehydrogenase-like predicted oxidoreductase